MKHRKLLNSELDRLSIEQYRDFAASSGIVVVLDNVRSAHNVGSALRSSDCFGVQKMIMCGITPVPPMAEIHKSALGAEDSVPWCHCDDTLAAVRELKTSGFRVACVEQTESSVSLEDVSLKEGERIALVFGNEVDGVRQDVASECDLSIEIPQWGTKHSLNVSVCVGVVLWQLRK